MTNKVVSEAVAPAAGDVRALGYGDTVSVRRSAVRRDDWGPLSVAVMVAYARGAHVAFVDDIEIGED